MVAFLGMLLFGCHGPQADNAGSDCGEVGDIDDIRISMFESACRWVIVDCDGMPNDRLVDCHWDVGTGLDSVLDEGGTCINWCEARAYIDEVRSRDCAEIPDLNSGAEAYDGQFDPLLSELEPMFYECAQSNY